LNVDFRLIANLRKKISFDYAISEDNKSVLTVLINLLLYTFQRKSEITKTAHMTQ